MSNNQSPTTIVMNTNTLSGAIDDILETLGLDRSAKSQLLNRVAARVAGPKHNWGYLTGSDAPVIAIGVDASKISINTEDQPPVFQVTPEEDLNGRAEVKIMFPDPTKFSVKWRTDEGISTFCMCHSDILLLQAGHPSAGISNNTEHARAQIDTATWTRMVEYVNAWIPFAIGDTEAADTIFDAFFQMCNLHASMEASYSGDIAIFLTEKLFRENSDIYSIIESYVYEGSRSLYDLIQEDYAIWIEDIQEGRLQITSFATTGPTPST